MNEYTLRGFCKKCESAVVFGQSSHTEWYKPGLIGKKLDRICNHKEPVWFLSAKQMKIVYESKLFWDWVNKKTETDETVKAEHQSLFLDENPFLVAKILKDAE